MTTGDPMWPCGHYALHETPQAECPVCALQKQPTEKSWADFAGVSEARYVDTLTGCRFKIEAQVHDEIMLKVDEEAVAGDMAEIMAKEVDERMRKILEGVIASWAKTPYHIPIHAELTLYKTSRQVGKSTSVSNWLTIKNLPMQQIPRLGPSRKAFRPYDLNTLIKWYEDVQRESTAQSPAQFLKICPEAREVWAMVLREKVKASDAERKSREPTVGWDPYGDWD